MTTHPPYVFQVFDSPHLVAGQLDFGIARASNANANHYLLIWAKGNGQLASRVFTELNVSTGSSEADVPQLSADGYPLIWFDSSIDRDPRNLAPAGGTLAALLAARPPVLRLTGRKRLMSAPEGGEREAQEAEILLKEDELARVCSYCGLLESKTEEKRWQKLSGDGYKTLYSCDLVRQSPLFMPYFDLIPCTVRKLGCQTLAAICAEVALWVKLGTFHCLVLDVYLSYENL